MHELSIALSLVEMAAEEAERLGGVRVEVLHLRLGPLSGVVREALLFSFDLAAEGTAIEGARLEIEDVPVVVFCPCCEAERPLPSLQHFHCPVCGTPTPKVVRGRELELTALEVTESATQDR
jgi:hydrogenase nickel incorporation protein HypA/HybF